MSHCGHHHHHTHQSSDTRSLTAAFVVIAVFMVVEAIGGFLSGSLALLADAAHMMTDALALALAASAQWLASRPADQRLHFGYRRTQVLAAFVNGIALVILLGWIIVEAIRRFFQESIDINWGLMLVIAIVGLIANGIAFYILHRSDSDNINVRGALLHVMSDLLGSVAAIFAAIVIASTGWTKIDPILSILVAFLIGRSAWHLIRETGHILMEGAPSDINVDELINGLQQETPEIEGVKKIQIWQLTPEDPQLMLQVTTKSDQNTHQLLQRIKVYLSERYGIESSTVQIDLAVAEDDGVQTSEHDDVAACSDHPKKFVFPDSDDVQQSEIATVTK